MPYALAFFEAVVFTLAGAAATLAATFFAPFKPFLPFAWRIWLWGSIGFVVANLFLLAILFRFLNGVGIAGAAPRHVDIWGFLFLGLILFGPVLFSSAGVLFGCWYGWFLARRRTRRPSV